MHQLSCWHHGCAATRGRGYSLDARVDRCGRLGVGSRNVANAGVVVTLGALLCGVLPRPNSACLAVNRRLHVVPIWATHNDADAGRVGLAADKTLPGFVALVDDLTRERE